MYKVKKLTVFVILLLSIIFVFASCNKDYSYTVTFETNGGSAIDPIIVNNENLSAIPVAPTKEGYTFAGWYLDPELQNNAEEALSAKSSTDIKVYAKWIKKTYTVNFLANGGTLVSGEIEQTIEHGNGAIAPIFTKTEHTLSWDKAFDNITSNTTITAVWTINTYTVTFKNWDNTVLKTEVVSYGGSATAPANPTKAKSAQYSYSFSSWDKALTNITENTEIIAQYDQALNNYTVTFSSGGVYQEGDLTQIIAYGGSATAPVFTKENYTLSWSQSLENITSDTTIFGQWSHIEGQKTELESIWETKETIFLEIWSDYFENATILDNYYGKGIKAIDGDYGFLAVECENQAEIEDFLFDFPTYSLVIIEGTNIICSGDFSLKTILTKDIVKGGDAYYDEDYNTLIRYSGSGEFTVPDGVINIGFFAFGNNYNLNIVNLPSSLKSIGDCAFEYCNLTTIDIPEGVTEIGKYAFDSCNALESIVIPSGIKRIEMSTFLYCGLTTVTIPDSVEYIGDSAFYGCANLVSININSSLTSFEGYAFYETAWYNALPDGPVYINHIYYGYKGDFSGATIELAEGTKGIAGSAFSFSSITSITIPEGVEYIGDSAFERCFSLTSVTLPSTIKRIGSMAFLECNDLTSINIPYGITAIENFTFYGCNSLTSMVLPESITEIGEEAFYRCALTEITLPSGLLRIGKGAFYNCSALSEITLPDSLVYIGSEAFSDCASLPSIILPNKLTKIASGTFKRCNLFSVSIPDSVVEIGTNAFKECSFTSINISRNIKNIENSAFLACQSLTNIIVDENNLYYKSIDGNLYSKDGTVLLCYALGKTDTSFVIPESVSEIADTAFYGETNLTSVTMPSNLKSIGKEAFVSCTGLTSLTISDSVETIGDFAFMECTNLASIHFPDSLTYLGGYAFSACSSLTSVNLANTKITTLVRSSLYNVPNLISITLPSTLTTIEVNTIHDCPNLVSVLIPSSVLVINNLGILNCSKINIYVEASSKPSGWHAQWQTQSYPVIYSSILSADKTYVVQVQKTEFTPATTQDPYRQGYTFDGWYTSADFSGTKYDDLSTAPITYLYAKWVEQNP